MKRLLLAFLIIFLVTTLAAQDTLSRRERKKPFKNYLLEDRPWTLELPLWLPGYVGSFAYGDVSVEGEDGVDPEHPIEPPPPWDPGGILSRIFTQEWYLKFFFITRLAYENDRFEAQFEALSGAVGTSIKFKANNNEIVNVNFRTTNLRLFGGYEVFQYKSNNKRFQYELFAYAGVRSHFHKVYSDLNNTVNRLDINPIWIEPIIGIQNQFTFKRWYMILQGDYGGLLIDSKYSMQISAYAYYRTGKVFSLKTGWNHLSLNHKGVFQGEDYRIRATFSGPSVAAVFHF